MNFSASRCTVRPAAAALSTAAAMRRVEISPKRRWAESARGRLSRRQIAAFGIAGERAVDEPGERGERARFAGGLAERKLARPVRFGRRKPQRLDRDAFAEHRSGQGAGVRRSGAGDGAGRGASARCRRQKAEKLPESAPSGFATSHGSRMSRPLKLRASTPRSRRRVLTPASSAIDAALVASGPENAAGVRRSGEREDDLVGLAAHDVEAPAARGEALLHRLQRLGEAPFRRARRAGGRCEASRRAHRHGAPDDPRRRESPAGRRDGSRRAARRYPRSRSQAPPSPPGLVEPQAAGFGASASFHSSVTTLPFSTVSARRPCLSSSARSPNNLRRQPLSAGTSARSLEAIDLEIVDGGDQLAGDAALLAHLPAGAL